MMSNEYYRAWEANFSEFLRRGVTPDDLDYVLPWYDEQFRSNILKIAKSLED